VKPFQKFPDRSIALIGHGLQRVGEKGKFLVLGADPPLILRPLAVGQKSDELRLVGDGRTRLRTIGSGAAQWQKLSG
jgi:hypothetical protein